MAVVETDFIINSRGIKKFHYYCDCCGKDRGYLQRVARGGRLTGTSCVRCANGISDVIKSGGYCKFCNDNHTLPNHNESNDYWYWELNTGAISGGYLRCKKQMASKNKQWENANPEKYAEKQKRGSRKYRSTSKGKLRSNISSYMSSKLSERDGKSKLEHLDWSIEELMKHLESKFVEGMSWDNYGSMWHVDHIVPDSWFQYSSVKDEEFKRCWSLSNLQPLWADKNYSKGDRFVGGY